MKILIIFTLAIFGGLAVMVATHNLDLVIGYLTGAGVMCAVTALLLQEDSDELDEGN